MRKIDKRLDASVRLAHTLVARAPTLTLRYDERCKSRLAARLDSGEDVALLLPRGTLLRDGDILVADDGGLVRVVAAAEQVLQVTASAAAPALLLMRAAYHLGNRHTPVELGDGYLRLEADSVLEQMLTRLGASVEPATLPFQPEPGAYGGGHRHGHDASFAEDYALAQQVFAEHHGDRHDHDAAHHHGQDHGDNPGAAPPAHGAVQDHAAVDDAMQPHGATGIDLAHPHAHR